MIETFFPLKLSHSSFTDALRCEVYFFRTQIQKFKTARNSDLIAGGLFAKACEISRRAFYNDGLDLDEAIELGYNSIIDGENTGDLLKSNDRIALLFRKYLRQYPMDESWVPIQLIDGSFAIEYKYEFDTGIQHPDLPDRNIIWTGKLDMLAEKRVAGGEKVKVVLDEKTTKTVKRVEGTKVVDIAKEEDAYYADGQMINYCWSAQQLGVNVQYAYVRRVPILKEVEPAFEIEIPITPFMVENWSKSTFNKIGELVERYKFYKEKGDLFSAFTANYSSACNAFGRSCEFKKGCVQQEWEEYLSEMFPQLVYDSEKREEVSLSDYIRRINESK